MIEQDEQVLLEGRAGLETPVNRGRLTLTDKRLIWERTLSIDPFADQSFTLPLASIRSCKAEGDTIILDTTDKGEVFIFPQWWMLSVISGNRRTKEWLREIRRAMKAETPAS
jgi:hypothetical protein